MQEKFELDSFQKEAIEHIQKGSSLIVCAPTGAGKTVIAKEAIRLAVENGQKVFYTAPLKALINQKYYEFCQSFGESKVGIITGDTNKNRDAQVIVMTTEIYRNMLYGTTFGSIDPFLQDLKYLIFDEFHFINDGGRGTVWEESVIYSPKSIQLIALSATINNPEDLVDWIKEVHGDCDLVQTHERPVPLHHHYFKDEHLFPLLTPNGKLNPKLKERNDNKLGKRRGKFRNRSNINDIKASFPSVVKELHKKDMLPAIYFVFSRKGCDKAAQECSRLQLLTREEEKQLNQEIDTAIALNPYIANFNQLDLLRKGIAAHHAGQLPQTKSLIEELFAKSLVKITFSTETLAAGINMPARSTVINNLTKASDQGFRDLKASEFLQMSGRAGRRGMDDAGYVITVRNGNYTAGEVAHLANSKPEDVSSHFNASYEMVLNLLQGHSYAEVKDLIEKSFGQSLVNKGVKEEEQELARLEQQIRDLAKPLCPGEIGDLKHYREMQQKLDQTRKQKKILEKKMDPEVTELEASLEILTMEAKHYPCNGCPKQKPCSKQMDKTKRYRKQSKKLEEKINMVKDQYWQNFSKVVDLLQTEKYLDENHNPTDIGKTCAALRSDNSFFITELLRSNIFNGLTVEEFAGLISMFVIGERKARNKSFANRSKIVKKLDKQIWNVARRVIRQQRLYAIDKDIEVNPNVSALVEDWASGCKWEDIVERTQYAEGDVLRGLRRTLDLCKQISKAPNIDDAIQNLAGQAVVALERDIVIEAV